MSALTSIQWTDRTWNPVRGCSVVSPGCVNCYAMKFAHRFSGPGKPYEGLTKQTKAGPQWTGKVSLVEDALTEPLRWKTPARVFVNSMSDLFHEAVPDAFIADVFATMARAPQHTFQILTKRPERMSAWMLNGSGWMTMAVNFSASPIPMMAMPWPLPNVWLGVSVENQATADARIPLLLQTPAAVRFVSYEPALGPIDLTHLKLANGGRVHALGGTVTFTEPPDGNCFRGLDWVIVGGESGPSARPCNIEWIRSAVQQCRTAGVPVFVKQLGARPFMQRAVNGGTFTDPMYRRLLDRKGGDPNEWDADLRVREFPGGAA